MRISIQNIVCSQRQMNTCHTSFSYILWAYSEHIMSKWSSRTSDQFIWLVSEKKTEAVNAYLIKNSKGWGDNIKLNSLFMRVIVKYVCFYIHKSKERERVTGGREVGRVGGGGVGGGWGGNQERTITTFFEIFHCFLLYSLLDKWIRTLYCIFKLQRV